MVDVVVINSMHSTKPGSESYSEALDQTAYLDEHGASHIILPEHHNINNGYIPSPMLWGAAIAVRTKNIRLRPMVLAPLLDPIRIAEDALVLDNISNGRLELSMLLGYRPSEYTMFGTTQRERVPRMEAATAVIRKAFTNEPFEHNGETVAVGPKPVQPGGPPLLFGGNSVPAARRAARIGDGFFAGGGDRELNREWVQIYRDECKRLGKEPGKTFVPSAQHVQVSEDPEKTWHEIGRYFYNDLRMYSQFTSEATSVTSPYSSSDPNALSLDAVRAAGVHLVLTPDECIEHARSLESDGCSLIVNPQSGGLPPEFGWEGIELLVNKVLPALK
jgi:alkanesulfonate monooxygenase SsuD/methylene tetrahydromethanopterin reductase-like flavin-dependent oxidoreductase (luciferase family)